MPPPPLGYHSDVDAHGCFLSSNGQRYCIILPSPVLFPLAGSLYDAYSLPFGPVVGSKSHNQIGTPAPSAWCQRALSGCLAGQQSQASGPGRSSAVGAHVCPSARVDTFAPVPSRRTKCATVSWQRPPTRQPAVTNPCWPPQLWTCQALPRLVRTARNRPRPRQPPLDYRGATILSGVDGACSVRWGTTAFISGDEPSNGSWTETRHHDEKTLSGNEPEPSSKNLIPLRASYIFINSISLKAK